MSKPLRVLLFIGALALICVVIATLGSRSGGRSALRQYVAELQAKGEKLTFEELTRGQLTNAVDSHTIITNAQPRLSTAGESPAMLEVQTYARPGEAKVTWRQPSPIWGNSKGPGARRTWEELERDLKAATDALQEIRTALKTPALNAGPRTNMWVTRRLNYVAIRTTAFWLMAAAENDLHQGRLEPALENLEALAALAYMERDEPTLVAHMIRVAVAGLGLSATWEALHAPGWTEPQLERLQRAWERVDLVEAVERGFVGERACGYTMLDEMRHSRGSGAKAFLNWTGGPSPQQPTIKDLVGAHVLLPIYKVIFMDNDELFYLKSMQQSVNGVRLLKAHRPLAEARQQLNQVLTNIANIARTPQRFRYLFSMIAVPNFTRAVDRAAQTETTRQMTLAAIALKRFQLRHGQLPPTLEALVPELLPALPWDYLGAKPLGYQPKAEGTFLLYSVGEDGKDDGGDPTPLPGNPPSLWNGRDAVWPVPVRGGQEN